MYDAMMRMIMIQDDDVDKNDGEEAFGDDNSHTLTA